MAQENVEKNSSQDPLLEYLQRDFEHRKVELKHSKSQLRFSKLKTYLIVLALALGPTAYLLTAYSLFGPKGIKEDYVAMVRINGVIDSGSKTSSYKIVQALEHAFEDEKAKGIVLLINSPGGSPVQSSLIHDRLLALRNQYPDKRVITVAEDMLTSGAYFIATGADEICVNRSTLVGSIGVISTSFGVNPATYGKYGIERRIWTAGERKMHIDTFLPVPDYTKEKMDVILEQMHKHFIDSVKQTRADKLKISDDKAFTGEFWTGGDAVKMGLVDGLCDFVSILETEFNVKHWYDYTPNTGLLDAVKQSFSTSTETSLIPELLHAITNSLQIGESGISSLHFE